MPTLIAACRACSQATRVAGLRRWAISISSTSEWTWLGSMSAGDGNWTAVFSGTANRLASTAAGAGAAGASLGGSNCHGESGEAGAKSRVSLQAPSSTNPAKVTPRNLAGCGKMRLSSIGTLRDGPSGLLRVREAIEIKNLILRSAPQERVSKDAERHSFAFFRTNLAGGM